MNNTDYTKNLNKLEIENVEDIDDFDEPLCGESFEEIDKLYQQMKDEFDNE